MFGVGALDLGPHRHRRGLGRLSVAGGQRRQQGGEGLLAAELGQHRVQSPTFFGAGRRHLGLDRWDDLFADRGDGPMGRLLDLLVVGEEQREQLGRDLLGAQLGQGIEGLLLQDRHLTQGQPQQPVNHRR